MAEHIALYGKGGTGKTTIAANLAAALAENGRRVLLIGSSPTADSSHLLQGETLPLPLAHYRQEPTREAAERIMATGYRGIGCIEAGEPLDEGICSARSVAAGLRLLGQLGILARFAPDFVIHDLPGDLGCISSALPDECAPALALVVTMADFQSLFAANRFLAALRRHPRPAPLVLVANNGTSSFEDAMVADFARQAGLPLAAAIPRSLAVRHSELYGKTVIEAAPLSTHAYTYRRLANLVSSSQLPAADQCVTPLSPLQLKEWAKDWGKKLGELEFGIVGDGSGI